MEQKFYSSCVQDAANYLKNTTNTTNMEKKDEYCKTDNNICKTFKFFNSFFIDEIIGKFKFIKIYLNVFIL